MKSKQETFDLVLQGIRKQGKASVDVDPIDGRMKCSYRSEDGCKCAAGLLIPDDRYTPNMEGTCANLGSVRNILRIEGYNPDFVRELQHAHDLASFDTENFISRFNENMKDLANCYKLEYA